MEILNFQWHVDNMATGGKPSHIKQLEFLKEMGIEAIVSLEQIPDNILEEIKKYDIDYLELEIDDEDFDVNKVDNNDWQLVCDFIEKNIKEEKKIFIHCSAGINRSVKLIRRYLKENYPLK